MSEYNLPCAWHVLRVRGVAQRPRLQSAASLLAQPGRRYLAEKEREKVGEEDFETGRETTDEGIGDRPKRYPGSVRYMSRPARGGQELYLPWHSVCITWELLCLHSVASRSRPETPSPLPAHTRRGHLAATIRVPDHISASRNIAQPRGTGEFRDMSSPKWHPMLGSNCCNVARISCR